MKTVAVAGWAARCRHTSLLIGLLLSACFTGGALKPDVAVYDLFGAVTPSSRAKPATSLPLRLADVQVPAWLNTPSMQYRLAYADPERRLAYSASRWAAPPAELIEQLLVRQGIAHKGAHEVSGCQLHLSLGEFIQEFETPEHSQALLEVRATLLTARRLQIIARHDFRLTSAAGAGAKAGVAAFVVAGRDLNRVLDAWLVSLERDKPDAVSHCRTA